MAQDPAKVGEDVSTAGQGGLSTEEQNVFAPAGIVQAVAAGAEKDAEARGPPAPPKQKARNSREGSAAVDNRNLRDLKGNFIKLEEPTAFEKEELFAPMFPLNSAGNADGFQILFDRVRNDDAGRILHMLLDDKVGIFRVQDFGEINETLQVQFSWQVCRGPKTASTDKMFGGVDGLFQKTPKKGFPAPRARKASHSASKLGQNMATSWMFRVKDMEAYIKVAAFVYQKFDAAYWVKHEGEDRLCFPDQLIEHMKTEAFPDYPAAALPQVQRCQSGQVFHDFGTATWQPPAAVVPYSVEVDVNVFDLKPHLKVFNLLGAATCQMIMHVAKFFTLVKVVSIPILRHREQAFDRIIDVMGNTIFDFCDKAGNSDGLKTWLLDDTASGRKRHVLLLQSALCLCDPQLEMSLRKVDKKLQRYDPLHDEPELYTASVERWLELAMQACGIPLLVTQLGKPLTRKMAIDRRAIQQAVPTLPPGHFSIDPSSQSFRNLAAVMITTRDIQVGPVSRSLTGLHDQLFQAVATAFREQYPGWTPPPGQQGAAAAAAPASRPAIRTPPARKAKAKKAKTDEVAAKQD